MKEIIKLAVVDDSVFFRAGLITRIHTQSNLKVVVESSNGKELIDAIEIENKKFDIALLDLEMPVMNGFKTIDYLSKHHPEIKVLVLTGHNDEKFLRYLLDKGVNGFLLKDPKKIENVFDAINLIYRYDYYFAGLDLRKVMASKNLILADEEINFTERQLEIVELICKQHSDKEISKKLFISERTVQGHKNVIFKKTNTHSTLGLALYAVKNNLINGY